MQIKEARTAISHLSVPGIRQLLANKLVLAGILFSLVVLTRIPFRSIMLYHWDSVNFAYAMDVFDITRDQPQPPGYILYVWLARAVNLAFNDPAAALVTISILASAGAVVALFYLGSELFDLPVGLIGAVLLASSPLFWFYGEQALPHTLDCLLVLICLLWLHRVMRRDLRYLYPAVILLAITGGVRQQTLVFLLPVTIYAFRRLGWKRWVTAALTGIGVCLLWFIPLVQSSGGLANYFRTMEVFGDHFQSETSVLKGAGFGGIAYNLKRLVAYTGYAVNLAVVPPVVLGLRHFRKLKWGFPPDPYRFLIIWVFPAAAFYTLIHMGQQGLVFVFLPALFLISAVCLEKLCRLQMRTFLSAAAILVAVNGIIFGWIPEHPIQGSPLRLLTRDTIRNSDAYYQGRFRAIRSDFPKESTILLATNWHHVEYYLPEYHIIRFTTMQTPDDSNAIIEGIGPNSEGSFEPERIGLRRNSQGRFFIVFFDPGLESIYQEPGVVQSVPLAGGGRLPFIEWQQNETLEYEFTNSSMQLKITQNPVNH